MNQFLNAVSTAFPKYTIENNKNCKINEEKHFSDNQVVLITKKIEKKSIQNLVHEKDLAKNKKTRRRRKNDK